MPHDRGVLHNNLGCHKSFFAKPFFYFPFLSQELSLKFTEVEALLVDLILDQRLNAKIDQIEGFLLLEGSKETSTSRKHDAMERWTNALRSLTSHIAERVEQH